MYEKSESVSYSSNSFESYQRYIYISVSILSRFNGRYKRERILSLYLTRSERSVIFHISGIAIH